METKYSRPRLIAHRGLATHSPMNSLASFQAAASEHFWAIETDIRKTKDGQFVCIHDETVDSMFDGSGRICDLTLQELREYQYQESQKRGCPDPGPIPTFEEYLEICKSGNCCPFIETKTKDVEKVLEIAFRYFHPEDVVLSSTRFEHLEAAIAYSDTVFVHHIFSDKTCMEKLAKRGRCGISYNYVHYEDAPWELLQHTHDLNVQFCLRAGDNPDTIFAMQGLGIDYIPTNCITPSAYEAYLQERGMS